LLETKWDRERRVPLSRETIASLRGYLRRDRPILAASRREDARPGDPLILSAAGTRLTPQGIYQAMGRAYRRGGGTGRFGLHRLRHLFGTTAAEGGMHPLISQLIMGHEDPKSQQIYQNPSAEAVKRAHGDMTRSASSVPRDGGGWRRTRTGCAADPFGPGHRAPAEKWQTGFGERPTIRWSSSPVPPILRPHPKKRCAAQSG
jgi:integrase-like protein